MYIFFAGNANDTTCTPNRVSTWQQGYVLLDDLLAARRAASLGSLARRRPNSSWLGGWGLCCGALRFLSVSPCFDLMRATPEQAREPLEPRTVRLSKGCSEGCFLLCG